MGTFASGIWEQVHQGLRAFIAKRVGNSADTDDILQEVFVRVHRYQDQLQHSERMVPWVFQITRNVIFDHYRATQQREIPVGLDTGIDKAHGASSEALEAEAKYELSACLRPMINRLSGDYREAITLVELEGLTHQEAAKRLGLSIPGMKSRVQRGRKQLRAMLDACCVIEIDRRRGIRDYELRQPNSCQ